MPLLLSHSLILCGLNYLFMIQLEQGHLPSCILRAHVLHIFLQYLMYAGSFCSPSTSATISLTAHIFLLLFGCQGYEKVLLTMIGHHSEPTIIGISHLLPSLNDALMHSPVCVQAHSLGHKPAVVNVAFPSDPPPTTFQSKLFIHCLLLQI